MKLVMSGLDDTLAPIELREQLSFTRGRVSELDSILSYQPGVEGCVLLSTCNRTELYLSCADGAELAPDQMLCQAAGIAYEPFSGVFVTRRDWEAVRHLLEVAGGLQSRIWGEDQILTQVKNALIVARESGSTDPVLETLFHHGVAAGKEIKSSVRLTEVPASAAHQAVEVLAQESGGLSGKKALVIGNGEMGRLAAHLLRDRGCSVTVTLRTYRHGATLVPAGCDAVPYDERWPVVENSDLLVSATTSPHYTVTAAELKKLNRYPRVLVDLAIPRDIEPAAEQLPGVKLYNVDTLGGSQSREIPAKAEEILKDHTERLRAWKDYRACLPGLERVKRAVSSRVLATTTLAAEEQQIAELAAQRSVDLLAGTLKELLTPELLEECADKLRLRTAVRGRKIRGEEGFRFPIFLDLNGKRCVVVGGGAVACRRASVLKRFGAKVEVISPECPEVPEGAVWIRRTYCSGDLAGAELVTAATDDRAVNHQVGEDARKLGIPVSVADAQDECTFFFPAICTGSSTVAGVVGRGGDHALTARAAQAVRSALEAIE